MDPIVKKETIDKLRVMSISLPIGLINDMRQDGTYKDQDQRVRVFMANVICYSYEETR